MTQKNVIFSPHLQVVWKETTHLGFGRAVAKKDDEWCTFVVARYKPKGNVVTQFTKNVVQGNFDEQNTCKNLNRLVQGKT